MIHPLNGNTNKTVKGNSNENSYQVKSGDTLRSIIKKQFNTNDEKQIKDIMQQVKKINPGIIDLNDLKIRQSINLPIITKGSTDFNKGGPRKLEVSEKRERENYRTVEIKYIDPKNEELLKKFAEENLEKQYEAIREMLEKREPRNLKRLKE